MEIAYGVGIFLAGYILRMILDYKAIKKVRHRTKCLKFIENSAYLQGVGEGYIAGNRKKESPQKQEP